MSSPSYPSPPLFSIQRHPLNTNVSLRCWQMPGVNKRDEKESENVPFRAINKAKVIAFTCMFSGILHYEKHHSDALEKERKHGYNSFASPPRMNWEICFFSNIRNITRPVVKLGLLRMSASTHVVYMEFPQTRSCVCNHHPLTSVSL